MTKIEWDNYLYTMEINHNTEIVIDSTIIMQLTKAIQRMDEKMNEVADGLKSVTVKKIRSTRNYTYEIQTQNN